MDDLESYLLCKSEFHVYKILIDDLESYLLCKSEFHVYKILIDDLERGSFAGLTVPTL